MGMYVRWCDSVAQLPFPLTVHKVYKYCVALRDEEAPATRASSFLSAGRYATPRLKFSNKLEIFDDDRVQGAMCQSDDRKRIAIQAEVLDQQAVALLEKISCESADSVERVLAGSCRFALGARLRGKDLVYLNEEPYLDLHPLQVRGISKRKQKSLKPSKVPFPSEGHFNRALATAGAFMVISGLRGCSGPGKTLAYTQPKTACFSQP